MKKEFSKDIWGTIEKINWVAFIFGAIFFFALVFIISAECIARYLFSYSLGWGFEVTSYIMVASTFLCLGHILSLNAHLKITLFVNLLGEKRQLQLNLVAMAFAIIIGIIMLWASLPIAWDSYCNKETSESAYKLLLWPYMSAVPLGCILFIMQCIVGIRNNILMLYKIIKTKDDLHA